MKLIDQHVKKIMEECKIRARDAGLEFDDQTLEFVVSNQDLLELSPKIMIPTLYDFWMHDVEVIKDKGRYSVYPHNPYETVINTRPAISFYNDNNPDWLNIMIFYHVLGHIDFFQNNRFFEETWNDDFLGKALSDKRRINAIREEMGENKRHVDYVIEFTRGLDNLVNFYDQLKTEVKSVSEESEITYFFNVFERENDYSSSDHLRMLDYYDKMVDEHGIENGEKLFMDEIKKKYPEFSSNYKKYKEDKKDKNRDLIQFLMDESHVINKPENLWMKDIMSIVRNTSIYFQPQIRTKIINEGWASLIHQYLFEQDERIDSHEIDYAVVNSKVLSNPKIGMNPYAIGCKLLNHIYDMGEKGKMNNFAYQSILDINDRKEYDMQTKNGWRTLFDIRENFNDFMLINFLNENDFQDFVTKNKLFVAGRKLNQRERKWEYYIKSKNGEDYRQMLIESLYHPPNIEFNIQSDGSLYLHHKFEGKELYKQYIENVLIGLEYLWGNPILLETTEFNINDQESIIKWYMGMTDDIKYEKEHVLYLCKDRKIEKMLVENGDD
ncbi:MAG: SpoVR family protein [Candidatus Woesearchaeota archaeon]